MESSELPPSTSLPARIGLFLGPALALVIGVGPYVSDWPGVPQSWSAALTLDAANPQLNAMAAVTALMACWWLTEAIPMAATALVPLVLFPLLGIMPGKEVAAAYGHYLVYLFLGGFIVALTIEESGLHRRVALTIVSAMGDNPRRIVAGFMLATALLSMWLSNTATTMMMLPIAVSILIQADRGDGDTRRRHNLGVALMLGIAYAASIGGVATLIGTPTNLAFAGAYAKSFPNEAAIGFVPWMVLVTPFSLVFLVVIWLMLVMWLVPVGSEPLLGGKNVVVNELRELGKITRVELRTALVFFFTASLWILREPVPGYGWAPLLLGENATMVNDGTSAVLMAVLCFAIPSGGKPGEKLLHWKATTRLPWGILLLISGGFALAAGMKASKLDAFLGGYLANAIAPLPSAGQAALSAFGMTWLTELTSNVAAVQMISPVLAETAKTLEVPPLILMIPATLAASCAFMLPVATPPNAIVYSSGRVRMRDMIKTGIWLNLLSVFFIVAAVWLLGRLAFGPAAAF